MNQNKRHGSHDLLRRGALFAITLLSGGVLQAVTYYVSPSGDNNRAGTSPATAWQTVAKVNQQTLQPGDIVLFQGGANFTDAGLYLDASDAGSASNRVVLASYGVGRATIQPPAGSDGLFIYNTAGVTVENLIFEGAGLTTSTKTGIFAYTDLPGGVKLEGFSVINCEVRGFYNGIMVGAWHNSYSGFRNVLVEQCLVHSCRRDGIMSYGWYPGSSTQQSHENLIFRDCEVYGVTGDPAFTTDHSGSGIIMGGVKGGLIERCYAHHNGGSAGNPSGGGPVGIWTWGSDSVTIQHCLVHDQKTTPGVKDGGGFDIDGGATNTLVQYCYSYNNEGPGYLVAGFNDAPPLSNGTFRYNISWRDGRRTANNMASGFHFWRGSNTTLQNITVHNNLVYTANSTGGPAVRLQSGAMSNIRFLNNIFAVSGGEQFVHINSISAFSFHGNAYWAVDANWNGGWRWNNITYTNLANWRNASGSPETLSGQNVGLQIDPQIQSLILGAQPTSIQEMLEMNAFQLLETSPLRGAGLNLQTNFGVNPGTEDFFGNALPASTLADIGPHQFVPESYTSWAAAAFVHLPGGASHPDAAPLADPDGDSILNILEYAFNGSPTVPNTASLPVMNFQQIGEEKYLALNFRRHMAGLNYIVEISSTLKPGSWGTLVTNPGDIGEEVTVADPDPVSASPRRFIRVRVTLWSKL